MYSKYYLHYHYFEKYHLVNLIFMQNNLCDSLINFVFAKLIYFDFFSRIPSADSINFSGNIMFDIHFDFHTNKRQAIYSIKYLHQMFFFSAVAGYLIFFIYHYQL